MRLGREPTNYRRLKSGVYIRAVDAHVHDAEKARLSDEVIEHLEALGYGAAGFD